ncbi:hypothetical protein J5N97_003208 [Dioscorea zingiberensis]|uniref:Uncharacterized protein n=1 Tax=Dioscorea zingiberensis TaxID=325984 RepID=A0A9D5D5R9_9LILI|nr:hypothetical protein J5N97_003208 [Dioscorea zingiberensis]
MDTSSPSISSPNDLIQSLSTPETKVEDGEFMQVEPLCIQPFISQPQSSGNERRQGLGDDDRQRRKRNRKRKNIQETLIEKYIDMRRDETDRYINAIKMNQVVEKKYTIGECVTVFNVVCDLFSSEDIVKATTLFKDKDNREFFLCLKEDRRVAWLRLMFSNMD